MLQPAQVLLRDPDVRAGRLPLGDPLEELLERDLQLQPGERRPDALVDPLAEAEVADDTAFKYCIEGNHGWQRVNKEYENDESFDMVLCIEAIEDPLSVVCDPSARKHDRSDMRYLFKFHDVPVEEFAECGQLLAFDREACRHGMPPARFQ